MPLEIRELVIRTKIVTEKVQLEPTATFAGPLQRKELGAFYKIVYKYNGEIHSPIYLELNWGQG